MLALVRNWKVIAGVAVLVAGIIGYQHYRIGELREELTQKMVELSLAEATSQTQLTAIKELTKANTAFEETLRVNAEKLSQLEREAAAFRTAADRARQDLARRRAQDDAVPECAALRRLPLGVCPDLARRLREREAAISTGRDR